MHMNGYGHTTRRNVFFTEIGSIGSGHWQALQQHHWVKIASLPNISPSDLQFTGYYLISKSQQFRKYRAVVNSISKLPIYAHIILSL